MANTYTINFTLEHQLSDQDNLSQQSPNLTLVERTAANNSLPDVTLRSLRVGERLSIISEGIIKDADDGESYESLVRQLKTLHCNHDDLKDACCSALHQHGFYTHDGRHHVR